MVVLTDSFEKVLSNLKRVDGIESVTIATRDGLLIAGTMLMGTHPETFAAMSAVMFGAAETTTSDFKTSSVNRVIVESKNCRIITTDAGPDSLLIVLTTANSNIGLILIELQKCAGRICDILK